MKRSSVRARPSARRTSPLSVWSDWIIPTHARIWITGVASAHFVPEHDVDELRRDDDEPDERRHRERSPTRRRRPDPDVGDPLAVVAHARERGEEDLLQRPGDPRERHEDHVRRERVRAERAGAEEAADQERAQVAPGLVEQVLAEHVPGEAAEPAQARDREPSATDATGVRHQSSTVDMVASASCWPTIAQAPKPFSAMVIPATAPTSVAAICRSSRRRNRMSRASSAICVVPSALTKKPTETAANSGRTSGSP